MKKIIILVFTTALAINASAQQEELKKLVNQSFTYFPRVQEANKYSEISETRVGLAKSSYLPNINGNATYSYIDPLSEAQFQSGPDTYRTVQFQPHNNYNANISLNQIIWDFGRTQSQIERSKADLLLSQHSADQVKLQLASQVANIYYGLIFLKKAIAVEDSVISFYQENMKMVEGRVKQGDALQLDVLNMETNIDQARNRKTELTRLFNRQLALMVYTTGTSAEPTLSTFDFQTVAEQKIDSNPELLAATQRVLASEADSQYARKNALPNLNFQASAGVRNGYQPDVNENRFNYLVGAGLTVPIFQGGRIRQNIALADKSVEANKFARDNVAQSLTRDVALVQADVNAYNEQLVTIESQIGQAREALRITQIRYRQGVSTYLDLLNATNNLQRAVLGQLNIQYQRCQAYIEQSRLTGSRFWE